MEKENGGVMQRWKAAMQRAHNKDWYKADEVDARIQELEEENEKIDVECTKRQLEIYRLRKALEKIQIVIKMKGLNPPLDISITEWMKKKDKRSKLKRIHDIATEALQEREGNL